MKEEKPGLTHNQYKDMIWKLWKKSPDNPLNQVCFWFNFIGNCLEMILKFGFVISFFLSSAFLESIMFAIFYSFSYFTKLSYGGLTCLPLLNCPQIIYGFTFLESSVSVNIIKRHHSQISISITY